MLTNSLKLKSTEWKPRHIISTDLYCIRMQSTLLLLLKKKKSQKKVLCVSRRCHPSALLPLSAWLVTIHWRTGLQLNTAALTSLTEEEAAVWAISSWTGFRYSRLACLQLTQPSVRIKGNPLPNNFSCSFFFSTRSPIFHLGCSGWCRVAAECSLYSLRSAFSQLLHAPYLFSIYKQTYTQCIIVIAKDRSL